LINSSSWRILAIKCALVDIELGEFKFILGGDEVTFDICKTMNPLNECKVVAMINLRDKLVEVPYEEVEPLDP
ncbi:hypothetical protein HAX54_032113, partial [Datura stramonium]|nr:hypothetical protein [Datura stramonium]